MTLNGLPLVAGLLPLATYHLCFVLAASTGHVAWCNPYIDSCASISATGRNPPEMLLFKGLMIPAAVIIAGFWAVCALWLRQFGEGRASAIRWMCWLGIIAALFLVIYTVALGIENHSYRPLRRTGALLSFTFTYLAQLLLARQLAILQRRHPRWIPCWPVPTLTGLCAILAVAGITSLLLGRFYSGYNGIEDAFEWGFALLLNSYFVVMYFVWRALDVRIDISIWQGGPVLRSDRSPR